MLEIFLAVFALFFVAAVGAGVAVAIKTKRVVQRGLERRVPQARRMVEDTTLRARRLAQPGAAGQLADLRLSLHTSIDSTRRALEAEAAEDQSLSEALSLCARLDEHARALDGELKMLEREPDKERVGNRLPELRERAARITHAADTLRWAAQDRAQQFADDELTALSRECEMEAGALRHWAQPPAVAAPPETGPETALPVAEQMSEQRTITGKKLPGNPKPREA